MRCKNCGWENASGNPKCEKCNAPLVGSMIGNSGHPDPSPEHIDLKGTVPEGLLFPSDAAAPAGPAGGTCAACGYPLGRGGSVCPRCGASAAGPMPDASQKGRVQPSRPNAAAGREGEHAPHMATINPWAAQQAGTGCSLEPIPRENERTPQPPRIYTGTEITLDRANTDPDNQTITSHAQAELRFENGAWYLLDKSAQQTTFVRAGRMTRLEEGDIVLLGNRRFVFKG